MALARDGLERRKAHPAVVDDRTQQARQDPRPAVQRALPPRLAQAVHVMPPPPGEQALGAAVRPLLAQIRPYGASPVVAHLGCRRKCDLVPALEEFPTDVDVVARRLVNRVETADVLERVP